MMTFSGSLFEARLIVDFVRIGIGNAPIEVARLEALLDSYDGPIGNIGCVFSFLDPQGYMGSIGLNTCSYAYAGINDLFVLGSGTPDLLNELDLEESALSSSIGSGSATELSKALQLLGFFSTAMVRQFFTGFGLSKLWGAGFEVVLCNKEGFYKPASNLTRIWIARKDGGAIDFRLADFCLYQEYVDDHLIVCPMTPNDKTPTLFSVPSFYACLPRAIRGGYRSPELFIDVCIFEENLSVQRVCYCRLAEPDEPPKLVLTEDGYRFCRKQGEYEVLLSYFRDNLAM